MKLTLYEILGVDAKASTDEITVAYARRLAKGDWTDPNTPSLLRQANEILSDPRQRVAYDASIRADRTKASHESDVDSDAGFFERWGKWIAAVVVLAGITWWMSAHRAAPSAAKTQEPVAAIQASPEAVDAAPVAQATEPAASDVAPMPQPITAPSAPRSAEDVFADAAPSVARINVLDASDRVIATGSGVVIEPGVMLTSCHVATIGAKLSVKLGDAVLPATIQVADEVLDLCRLNVPGMRAPPLAIVSVDTLRPGQRVYAIGAPQGLELTISEGIVSALRKVDEGTIIQTTAPISPGSSGGGLFDLSGRLVGIMTFQHRFGQNLNFALPADWIAQMRARHASGGGLRQAVAGQLMGGPTPVTMILGRWLCRDWLSGRTSQFDFGVDGRVQLSAPDNSGGALSYGISGKALQLFDARRVLQFTIEELTARKMVLHGREQSIACERE